MASTSFDIQVAETTSKDDPGTGSLNASLTNLNDAKHGAVNEFQDGGGQAKSSEYQMNYNKRSNMNDTKQQVLHDDFKRYIPLFPSLPKILPSVDSKKPPAQFVSSSAGMFANK